MSGSHATSSKRFSGRKVAAWVFAAVVLGVGGAIMAHTQRAVDTAADHFLGGSTITFKTTSGPVLRVDVGQGLGCSGNGWVFPGRAPVDHAPGTGRKKSGQTWDRSPRAFGAVIASGASVKISVTGPTDHAITLTGLRFHVLHRAGPRKGYVVNRSDGCGAAGVYRYGAVDLASPAPHWVTGVALPKESGLTALRFPYTVTATDVENIDVDVFTRTCTCSWTASLDWVDGDRSGTSTIDDHGRPFEMAPNAGLKAVAWTGAGSAWKRTDDPPLLDRYGAS